MKNKGFTLIELLAVIVILAIILLISVPMVMDVIEGAKKGAFESSAKMIHSAAKLEHATAAINGNDTSVIYTFEDGVQTSNVDGRLLELNGEEPEDGKIVVSSDGTIELALYNGKYCSYTENSIIKTEELTIEECEVKLTIVLETAEITYINNPTDPSYSVNATSCLIGEVEVTHIIDKRDNKTYALTKVGNQCWFRDNLAYTTPECLGTSFDDLAPHDACATNGGSGWDQDEVKYQWEALMNGNTTEGSQGLCPSGFHVASDPEWKTLEMFLGMTQIEADGLAWRGTDQGTQLKSIDPSWAGTDTVGFNANPPGQHNIFGELSNVGSRGYWWTSTSVDQNAWRRSGDTVYASFLRSANSQAFAFSARCIMD